MRLFIGIPLPPIVIDELTQLTARLRSKEDNFRWPAPETWHVTLQFLALVDADTAVARVAQRVAQGGHGVPEDVIRRRYHAGLRQLFTTYMALVDSWTL